MATYATYTIATFRNDPAPFEFPVRVRGMDLTNISLALEIRLAPDTPGVPYIALAKVTNPAVQGLRVAGVTTINGFIESDLRIRIDKASLQGLPYAGELGDATPLSYALVLGGRTRMCGPFVVLPSSYGSDAAPVDRISLGGAQRAMSQTEGGVLLTIDADQVVVLEISGFDVVAAQAAIATAAASQAEQLVGNVATGLSYPVSVAALVANGAVNPNAWDLSLPAGVAVIDKGRYSAIAAATPTGNLIIGGYPVLYDDGSPVGAGSGVHEGWLFEWRYDGAGGANVFRFVRTAYDTQRVGDLLKPPALVSRLTDIRDAPWGAIGANNAVTTTEALITDCGPSTFTDVPGRKPGAPIGYAPLDLLVSYLNAAWPLDGVNWIADKQAIGGQTIEQFAVQLANSNAYTTGRSRFILAGPGPNDFQIGNMNSGEAYTGARDNLLQMILANKAKNMATALCTSHHTCTPLMDYTKFYTQEGSGFPQYWPRYVEGPVDPETEMYPPASKSAGGYGGVPKKDMTGSGVLSEYDLRFWHGNRMVRSLAALFPDDVVLLDFEWAWFRYGVEVHGPLALFDQVPGDAPNVIHPNVLGYQVSACRVLQQFAWDLAAGRFVKRIYLGDY